MTPTVALRTRTLDYPQGGGHQWVYLNWALGLRAAGCEVVWLEEANQELHGEPLEAALAALRFRLERFGLLGPIAVYASEGSHPASLAGWVTGAEALDEADLLLDIGYSTPAALVRAFPRAALVDIDPGLFQLWWAAGTLRPTEYDLYFTIGETVGTPAARFPDGGVEWHHTPPPVYLPAWPVSPAPPGAAFTTVSHWWDEWIIIDDQAFDNSKRAGFAPYLDLPRRTSALLELALDLPRHDVEARHDLESRGWRIRDAWTVCGTPEDYRGYIQRSGGEFSCAKPSCAVLANAWISDRTLCYLASGKPAVVQHTGPSRYLPDDEGLLRFRSPREALHALATVAADPARHAARARELAEMHFDARAVTTRVLERALDVTPSTDRSRRGSSRGSPRCSSACSSRPSPS